MSLVMPVVEARRIKRTENCGNCKFHDYAPDGRSLECHRNSPQGVLAQPSPNAPPQQFGFWPPTGPGMWCGEHRPYIQMNGSGN